MPIPAGPDLSSLGLGLLEKLDRRAEESRDRDGASILDRFGDEYGRMLPLPGFSFRPQAVRFVTASRRSLVRLDGAVYSVPCGWAGLEITAHVGAAEVEFVGPSGSCVHPRLGFGKRSVYYRHYIAELSRKPQALRQVADELVSELGEPFGEAWRRLREESGPRQGARIFAQLLKGLEQHGERVVGERIRCALARGEPLHLALVQPVVEPRLADEGLPVGLQRVEVAAASAADFDILLGGAR